MESREANERAKCGLGRTTNSMVSDEAGRLGGKHGSNGVEGKGFVVGAATNAQVSSTSSKHVQQAFFDRVGDGGRVLGLSFGEQQVEDDGRVVSFYIYLG